MFREAYGSGAISERRPYTPSHYPLIRQRTPALREFYAGICSRSRLFEILSGQRGKKSSKTIVTLQEVSLGVFQQFFFKATACRMNRHRARRRTDMLMNRRKSERRECRRVAKIHFGTGSLPRDCVITDVSKGGAKVIAEYPNIPAEFTITFSTGDQRQCRLAWRIGCEFGAEFVD
jgi:hypothetical protein